MDSEEVLILGVENSAECLCLGKRKTDKGKAPADASSRRPLKKSRRRNSKHGESCLVILDGSGDDYLEVYGGNKVHSSVSLSDSATDIDDLECLAVPKLSSSHDSDRTNLAASMMSSDTAKRKEEDLLNEGFLGDESSTNFPSPSPLKLTGASLMPSMSQFNSDYHQSVGSNSSIQTSFPYQSQNQPSSSWYNQPPDSSDPNKNNNGAASLSSSEPRLGTNSGTRLQRTPTCWTNCPNCPPNKKRKYHLIDVAYDSAEWSVVSSPLVQLGFSVSRVQRIQNEALWQRLCYEKQLMLRDRPDVNEQLLYHTSRTAVSTICEEGLDVRLSMNGSFGRGIYFSDSPFKCNCYWSGGTSRYMFCCRVLLGEAKTYSKGQCEQLMREPAKVKPKPGEPKFYDSVMGNLSGHNEFVVYNAYRVMPEYVLHYTPSAPTEAAAMQARLVGTALTVVPHPPKRKRGKGRGSRRK